MKVSGHLVHSKDQSSIVILAELIAICVVNLIISTIYLCQSFIIVMWLMYVFFCFQVRLCSIQTHVMMSLHNCGKSLSHLIVLHQVFSAHESYRIWIMSDIRFPLSRHVTYSHFCSVLMYILIKRLILPDIFSIFMLTSFNTPSEVA